MVALDQSDLDLLREVLRSELSERPAPASAPAAEVVMITQRNCELTVGLSPRQFLDLLRRDDAPPSARVGKVRLVRREALVGYLDRLATRTRDVETAEPEEPEVDGVEDVLRGIGCATVGRRRGPR